MYIHLLIWERIASFLNCLCTLQKLWPATAALFFGVVCPWDMADQGVAFLAFLAHIITEKLLWQQFWEGFNLHIGQIARKGQYKKFPLAFLFISFFLQKICRVVSSGTYNLFYDPKWLPIFMIFWLHNQKINICQFLEDKHENYFWWKL